MGHQFIIKPKFTASKAQIDTTFERFLRDASLKCYFAGDDNWAPSASKLYTKSVWQPPFPPIEIDTCLCRFQKAVKSLFVKRKTKSNITKFQNELVESMRKDDTHVKARTDKGLGPAVVKVSRYKKDALVHLTDTTTYEIISEDQGHQEIQELKRTIFKWTIDNRLCLSKSEVNYIRKKLDNAKDVPYGYFYLLCV